jgi:hypothetical protein
MGHIVRRGAAGSSRRSEPRPTAELSKEELHGLIREHDHAEPELEIAAEVPPTPPSASSPRMLAHTLRRAPSPGGPAPTARGSSRLGATEPGGPIDRTDISTIEMPRVERTAAADFDEFSDALSEDDLTRQLRHRVVIRDEFDESIPPAENDFEADCAGMDPPFPTAPGHEPRAAIADDIPRVDLALGYAVPEARPSTAMPVHAPASRTVRVLTITLAFLVAVGAGFLLIQSAS